MQIFARTGYNARLFLISSKPIIANVFLKLASYFSAPKDCLYCHHLSEWYSIVYLFRITIQRHRNLIRHKSSLIKVRAA